MEIIFDATKDIANINKHGISLANTADVEWDTLHAVLDLRYSYSEDRMVGIAYIGMRLYVLVYVGRDEVRRIISLRKANRREVNRYAKT
jgi:uncharacterized DUF497 family protein